MTTPWYLLILGLARGSGKTSLMAAWAIHELLCGQVGAQVVIVAVDERQAGVLGNIAKRMCQLNEHLADRVIPFTDRITCPVRGSSIQWLPASEAGLQGLGMTLAIVDEIGHVDDTTFEAIMLASGKVPGSLVVGIGTPGPRPNNVLARMRESWLTGEPDPSFRYIEHSAADFLHHPVDCLHCWALAMPSLGDFLDEAAVRATLPPRTSENAFRRARLLQWPQQAENPLVTREVWDSLADPTPIPDGADVVIALDGSFNDVARAWSWGLSTRSRSSRCGRWQSDGHPDWRVDVLAVEDSIRRACKKFRVAELAFDPFRWSRSGQVLAGEGLRVAEFPFSPSRITRATTDLVTALASGGLSM